MKSYLHRYVITILLVGLRMLSFSQTATIVGIVKDKETNQPVGDAMISIGKAATHMHTDSTGRFSFKSLPAGNYTLSLTKFGYEPQTLNIILLENEQKELNIPFIFNPKNLSTIDITTDKPISAASSKYINKVDFENRPKNSAQDMLRLVPGLFIAQHAGGGKAEQIFIRGFDCDHGTDVATFVDGIPVNMPSHGHGQGYEDLHFLIPETVQGMDVFKGPYSPLFGDFATGAAVEFHTVDTLENNLIQLETGYIPNISNISTKRVLALLELPKFSSNVNSYFAVDILNNRGYFEKNQHFNRFNVFSKTTFQLNNTNNISFSVSGFGSSWNASGQVPDRAVKSGLIDRYGSIDDTEGGSTSRNNLNLVYKAQIKGGAFESQVYSSTYRFKLFSNFTFYLEDSINGDEIEQDDNRIIRGLNVNYSMPHKIGTLATKYSIGANFRADEIENQLWHVTKRTRLKVRANSIVHQRSSAIFMNEAFYFNGHFRLELGARYDYYIFDVEDQLPTDSTHLNYSGYNYQTLLSPKINFIYSVNNRLQFFVNAGSGFHSNDARSSVQESTNHQLPRAFGAEIGTLTHLHSNLVVSIAAWWMDLENELVYVGDDGTTENKGPSRRTGIDISTRLQITKWLYADADLNISKNIFLDTVFGTRLEKDYSIPLAPMATSAGGLTVKLKGFEAGLRYRYIAERPANESNTVVAKGYSILDFNTNYKTKRIKIGLVIENLLNTEWNEAQFNTESKLPFETQSTEELHYTPGTPFSAKLTVGYLF